MNQAKHETYTEDFKRSSVMLALESIGFYAKTARALGVKDGASYTWADRYALSKKLADMPLQEALRRHEEVNI
jgi:transposase